MENELGRLIDALPGFAWTALVDGRADFLSRRWREYLGLSLQEASAWDWQAVVHPEDLPKVLEGWRSILASGDVGELEARLRHANGEYHWFLISVGPLRDAQGKVTKWCCTNTEIRKRLEQALRQCELDLRLLIDSIPVPAVVTTASGEIEAVNGPTLEYFGVQGDSLKGWTISDTIHPDDRQHAISQRFVARGAGSAHRLEERHRGADGIYRQFNVVGLPLRDTPGHDPRWVHLFIDIDERKHADEARLPREHNLRSMIDTIPMTAWSTGPDGYCDFLNQRWLDFVGFEKDQALGWGLGGAIHPDDLDQLLAAWKSCLASGAPLNAEARMRRFDGVYRWFMFVGNPLRDEAGTSSNGLART
jgi:PAS domain S-box-containing protein